MAAILDHDVTGPRIGIDRKAFHRLIDNWHHAGRRGTRPYD